MLLSLLIRFCACWTVLDVISVSGDSLASLENCATAADPSCVLGHDTLEEEDLKTSLLQFQSQKRETSNTIDARKAGTRNGWGLPNPFDAGTWTSDAALQNPSNAPLLRFYMYRSVGPPPDYPQQNVDMGSLDGALWYLHNEVIGTCSGAGYLSKGKWGDRKFGHTRLRRFLVSMKATSPLYALGMNFSVFKAFDSGEATGPHLHGRTGPGSGGNSAPEWWKYGFTIGCEYVGQFPHQQWPTGNNYPNTIWYSLPGPCPIHKYSGQSGECGNNAPNGLPGGHCDSPTGAGDCTYHVQDAGELDIDEMVGIKPRWRSRADFCSRCGTEGGAWHGGGCGLDFWGPNIADKAKNMQRGRRVKDLFAKKYPHFPKDLPRPPCDFNAQKFGFHRPGPPKSESSEHDETVGHIKCAKNGCGTYRPGHFCQCNDKCTEYKSCCDDYNAVCEGGTLVPTLPPFPVEAGNQTNNLWPFR